MIFPLSLVMLVTASAAPAAAQSSACTQPLATVTVAERSYAVLNVREFEGRVYVYVPEIKSSTRGAEPFTLSIVEGIYGRPFVQTGGTLDEGAFARVSRSANVRTSTVSVRSGGGAQRTQIARAPFVIDAAVAVAPQGTDRVTLKICRGR